MMRGGRACVERRRNRLAIRRAGERPTKGKEMMHIERRGRRAVIAMLACAAIVLVLWWRG